MATISERVYERNVWAAEDPEDDDIGELEIAEYVVFLLALETYTRYVEEHSEEGMEDDLIRKAVQLIKLADRKHLATIRAFLGTNLPSSAHTRVNKAFRFLPNSTGLNLRSVQLRMVLTRGGASAMRAVFKTNKALQEVKAAMAAATVEDADAALDKFAVISMRNMRLRKWIDEAAKTAGSGTFQNAVSAGSSEAVDDVAPILAARVQQQGSSPTSEDHQEETGKKDDLLLGVQQKAQEAAQRTMAVSGEPDAPPSKSEVIGIATAAAVAAVTDPNQPNNIPIPLRGLDPEQRAAALTDGRVLVAAGAGAGKSTTLVARIDYLVKDRGTNPARIMACSFSTASADELKVKIAKRLGYSSTSTTGVQVGTMHALFAKFIVGDKQVAGFGTPEEQAMLRSPRLIAPSKKGQRPTISPTTMSTTIRNMWLNCGAEALASRFGFPVKWMSSPPKAKKAGLLLNKWRGNDVSIEQAKEGAHSEAEAQAVVWYEFYSGIKGDIPGWRPPCASPAYDKFMGDKRKGGERLGDLDDMLKVFLDILRRDPEAKKTIQGMFDHILVDEVQDSNLVQHQILELMSEHIGDGSDGKSIWMIGDEIQAIYQFRGAQPELFTGLYGKQGWKIRMIRTNYRCEPEIVEVANKLKAHNNPVIPMEANANPNKPRGKASIVVETPADNVAAAISTLDSILKDMAEGAKAEDYAVLARTNAELNDFETACIINEIPYMRRGGKGFLEAPESKAVLGYMDLASGNDYEKMKQSLVSVIMKPDRKTFLGPDDVTKAVDDAIDDIARRERVDKKSVSPMALLEKRNIRILADKLKLPSRLKIIDRAKGDIRKGEWMYGKQVDELAENLSEILPGILNIQDYINEGTHTSEDLLNFILDMKQEVTGWDSTTRRTETVSNSLREQITQDTSLFSDDDDDEDEVEEEVPTVGDEGQFETKKKDPEAQGKGLGAVQFLFQMVHPNANDQANNNDPSTAQGFSAKIARYSKLSDTLRIDPKKWKEVQAKIVDPAQRQETPPAITLSTVHGVKGLEWDNVSVLMPHGKFPPIRKQRPDEPPIDPVEAAANLKAERNLAYVALTRAKVNLEVLCPMYSGENPAGISQFVFEAGLHAGENVIKEGASEVAVKTATAQEEDSYVTESVERFAMEYVAAQTSSWKVQS